MFVSCCFADIQSPYSCTGNFQTDFAELCRRVDPPFVHTPDVVIRPHRPASPTLLPVVEEKTTIRTSKLIKKEDKSQPGVDQDKVESPSMEKGGCILRAIVSGQQWPLRIM